MKHTSTFLIFAFTLASSVSSMALTACVGVTAEGEPSTNTLADGGSDGATNPNVDGGSSPSDGGLSGTPVSADQRAANEKAVCDAWMSTTACAGGPSVPNCNSVDRCHARGMVPGAAASYAACLAAPKCGGRDACLAGAEASVPGGTAFQSKCRARAASCGHETTDIEFCEFGFYAYTDSKGLPLGPRAEGCLAYPCGSEAFDNCSDVAVAELIVGAQCQ